MGGARWAGIHAHPRRLAWARLGGGREDHPAGGALRRDGRRVLHEGVLHGPRDGQPAAFPRPPQPAAARPGLRATAGRGRRPAGRARRARGRPGDERDLVARRRDRRTGGRTMDRPRRDSPRGGAGPAGPRGRGGGPRHGPAVHFAPHRAGVTVLVTGGSGLVGSHVIEALRSQGEPVRVWVRPPPAPAVRALGAEPVIGDITDPASWRVASAGVRGIVHAAALVAHRGTLEDFLAVNVGGTRQAIVAARANGARLVHISSVAGYGRTSAYTAGAGGVTEDFPLRALAAPAAPGRAYNATTDGKEALTQRGFADAFAAALGVRVRRLRLPYGVARLAVDLWARWQLLRRPADYPGIGGAAVRFLSEDNPFVTVRAQRELGWSPPVPAREAVRRTVRWVLANEKPGS